MNIDTAKKILLLLFGTASAKFMPILMGGIIARELGAESYTVFISFLLLSNVISSFSILGCSPQILSIKNTKPSAGQAEYRKLLIVSFIFFLISITTLEILTYFGNTNITMFNQREEICLFIYTFGLFFIHLSAARLNNLTKTNLASFVWITFTTLSLGALVTWIVMEKDLFHLLKLITFASVISGAIGAFITLYLVSVSSSTSSPHNTNQSKGILGSSFEAIYLSLFGLLMAGGIYYLQKSITSVDAMQGAYFSFLYQFFTIAIFIPSILGNILIPNIANGATKPKLKFYAYYSAVSLVFIIAFSIAHSLLLNIYKISLNEHSPYLLLSFAALILLACTNAYSNQLVSANKKFIILTISAILWASCLFIASINLEKSAFSAIVSMIFAYLVSSSYLFFYVSRNGLLHFGDKNPRKGDSQ